MSERPGTENQETDTSEPLYTRAEVEIMINEMLAAKLAELENAFPTHIQPSVPSLTSKKGKEPEIFVPWLREQDILYHKGLLENIRPAEEVFNVSYASEIGESSVGSESEFLRKEIAYMNMRGQAYNDFGENTNTESRVTSPKAMYKPFDFNGDSDPTVHLDQCELTAETNGTLPSFRKEMYFLPFDDFMDVRQVGMDIERRIWLEALKVDSSDDYSGPALNSKRTSGPKIGTRPSGKFQGEGGSRKFSDLGMSLSRMLEKLMKKNLLQPLEPRPLPDPVPAYFDLQVYCDFHQSKGHHTNGCKRLRHAIQDLIDQGKMRDPSKGRFRNQK